MKALLLPPSLRPARNFARPSQVAGDVSAVHQLPAKELEANMFRARVRNRKEPSSPNVGLDLREEGDDDEGHDAVLLQHASTKAQAVALGLPEDGPGFSSNDDACQRATVGCPGAPKGGPSVAVNIWTGFP